MVRLKRRLGQARVQASAGKGASVQPGQAGTVMLEEAEQFNRHPAQKFVVGGVRLGQKATTLWSASSKGRTFSSVGAAFGADIVECIDMADSCW